VGDLTPGQPPRGGIPKGLYRGAGLLLLGAAFAAGSAWGRRFP